MESEEDRTAVYGASPREENPKEPIGTEDRGGSPVDSQPEDDLPPKRRRSNDGYNSHGPSGEGESRSERRGNRNEGETMSLLVRHLKFATPPGLVRKYFEQCGEVKDVYLPLDYERGNPRGFGFVEFANARDAETALRVLDGTELDGSTISISVAQHGRKTPSTMRQRSSGNRRRFRREPYDNYDRSGSPYRGRSSRGYRDGRYGTPRGGYDSYRDGPRGGDSFRSRDDEPPRSRYDYDRSYRDGPSNRSWGNDYRDGPRDSGPPRSSYSGRRGSR